MIPPNLKSASSSEILTMIRDDLERQTLDYSVSLPGNDDKSKLGYLKGITSLANTAGGQIAFGVVESDKRPTDVPGILVASTTDEEQQRLESMMRDRIRPRLDASVNFQWVNITDKESRYVLVCRIPQSWLSPHAVTIGESFAFYGRNSIGSAPLDINQIRSAFTMKEGFLEQALKHRDDRLRHILSRDEGWMPVRIEDGAGVVLHVIPVSAFSVQFAVNLRQVHDTNEQCQPLRGNGWNSRQYSAYGVQKMDKNANGDCYTYASMARSGIVEALWAYGSGIGNEYLPGELEYVIVPRVEGYLKDLQTYGVVGPYLICLTLYKSRGRRFYDSNNRFPKLVPVPHDPLKLPEVMIDDSDADVVAALKPVFDALWNCCGVSGSPHYEGELGPLRPRTR